MVNEIYGHVDVHDPAFDAALRRVWGEAVRSAKPSLLPHGTSTGRQDRDRLEILTALINAPSFDPLFRGR